MITLEYIEHAAVTFTSDATTLTVFGNSSQENGISLLAAPLELPDATTISWPGEYDFSGVAVTGISHADDTCVSYVLRAEGMSIAFVHSPMHEWSTHEIELLGPIDVLVLPAGTSKFVQLLIDEIDPRLLIVTPGNEPELLADTIKICGATGKEVQKQYKIKGSLPVEGREVIIFG